MTVFRNERVSTPAQLGASSLHVIVMLMMFPISVPDLLLCLLMLAIGTLNNGAYYALTYFDQHSTAALKAVAIAEQIKIKVDASKTAITYLRKFLVVIEKHHQRLQRNKQDAIDTIAGALHTLWMAGKSTLNRLEQTPPRRVKLERHGQILETDYETKNQVATYFGLANLIKMETVQMKMKHRHRNQTNTSQRQPRRDKPTRPSGIAYIWHIAQQKSEKTNKSWVDTS